MTNTTPIDVFIGVDTHKEVHAAAISGVGAHLGTITVPRGGNRQANAALYRVVIVRMRGHQPTLVYVRRRTAKGKSKSEIIRCLKRYVAREIFGYLCAKPTVTNVLATSS